MSRPPRAGSVPGEPSQVVADGASRRLGSARRRRLAELLIAYREGAGLRQSEVAQRLGRHQPFVSNLESGQRRVDIVELIDLADVVGFDLHALIDELARSPRD